MASTAPEDFNSIEALAGNIKTKLDPSASKKKVVAIYAFNATGKTRLSNFLNDKNENGEEVETEELEAGSEKIKTLCYNAFLEDMFIWDNEKFILKFDPNSWFMKIIKTGGLDGKIIDNFKDIVDQNGLKLEPNIDFKEGEKDKDGNDVKGEVSFEIASGDNTNPTNIKISKSEESVFVRSVFYTILEAAIFELILKKERRSIDIFDNLETIIIDDPISSIDDTRIIALAVKLVHLIKNDHIAEYLETTKNKLLEQGSSSEEIEKELRESRANNYSELKLKFLLTTHHALYYNVLVNSFNYRTKDLDFNSFSLSRDNNIYKLTEQGDSPFSYHLAVKELIQKAINDNTIEKYHFNLFRALLEKTANFLGYKNWFECIKGENEDESRRLLNHYSHGKLSDLESNELSDRDKILFQETFDQFIKDFKYN